MASPSASPQTRRPFSSRLRRQRGPRIESLLSLLAVGVSSLGLIMPMAEPARAAAGEGTGGKGAQVYCFMRSNGNDHQVSWNAAYSLIKRQSASLFRTSPEHAAVMITEAVVNNPGSYPDCGRYLGDLYKRERSGATSSGEAIPTSRQGGAAELGSTMTRSERYN